MATAAQIEANRRNAQKSTGPRTPEGKAAVASNACKHGLRSRYAVIPGYESEVEFEQLRASIHQRLQPAAELEIRLVDRIVDAEWRLDRIVRIETVWYEQGLWSDVESAERSSRHDRLLRYEAHLTRLISRTLRDLDRLRRLPPPQPRTQPEPARDAHSAEQTQSPPRKRDVPVHNVDSIHAPRPERSKAVSHPSSPTASSASHDPGTR